MAPGAVIDADGTQNTIVILYTDAACQNEHDRAVDGVFTGLIINTQYWSKTEAQVKNSATGQWETKLSNAVSFITGTADNPSTI